MTSLLELISSSHNGVISVCTRTSASRYRIWDREANSLVWGVERMIGPAVQIVTETYS